MWFAESRDLNQPDLQIGFAMKIGVNQLSVIQDYFRCLVNATQACLFHTRQPGLYIFLDRIADGGEVIGNPSEYWNCTC
jgi:hypothetical protein